MIDRAIFEVPKRPVSRLAFELLLRFPKPAEEERRIQEFQSAMKALNRRECDGGTHHVVQGRAGASIRKCWHVEQNVYFVTPEGEFVGTVKA